MPRFSKTGPSIALRPAIDVIEANQDGTVELFMNNPSLNDVTLKVDAQVSVPSGIHVYGESFGQGAGAGVVSGAGQFTADYELALGDGGNIEVRIQSNQIGDFKISYTPTLQ